MILRVTDHPGRAPWTEAACPCGDVRRVIAGGAGAGITADELAAGVAELVDHARACPAASDAAADLLRRLMAERYPTLEEVMRP